ncbi:hypothetical protein LOTGIDRAFT_235397 [Lottia gigantea]|uniref:Uncharacterized protein n=1 Tax=Lottia gigantea TaxID=225164 RepID=V3ZZC2_LOTGI|nr:hypothetical protein LOTGIDRAFT_235397 [Lottia gigantea]ESO86331.1 hypothetical protein LOTGIDRAFT_235397 [Lottia gigantea]
MALTVLCMILLLNCVTSDVPYKELYYDQIVDHFNYISYGQQRFKQRYLIQDKWFDPASKGPIFFYTGNEGPITSFWNATGFIFDIAPQFNALVVFIEHRYYGKSLPFGADSFKDKNYGLLTIEQAMADFAVLITDIKHNQYKANKSPIITFGGSYGGMLSAYMRFKYSNIIAGAIAASAPIYMLSPKCDPTQYFVRVTEDFKQSNPQCSANVRKAFTVMENMVQSGQAEKVSEKLHLCETFNSTGYNQVIGWIRNAFVSLAMFDYPYPTNFMGQFPAFPVDVSCSYIVNSTDLVSSLGQMVALFYNGTNGSKKCFDIWTEYVACADPSGCGLGPDSHAWDIQACSEVPMYFSTDGVEDMFPPMKYDAAMRRKYCQKKWGITPRDGWVNTLFWGIDILGASNILFSNGGKDPWAFAGVLHNLSDNLTSVIIPDGAHHLDLRGANPRDPPDVFKARELEKYYIRLWINTAYNKENQNSKI